MCRQIGLVLIVLITLKGNEAAKILAVFPTPSISHQVVFRPLTQELAKRGHEVTVITTDPAFPKGEAPRNITEIDIHDISYIIWRNFVTKIQNSRTPTKQEMDEFQQKFMEMFVEQTQVHEVQDVIRNQNGTFDLILVEAWVRHLLGFSHVIKAPVIQVSSFGGMYDNYNVIGAPTHPLIYSSILNTRIYNLTLWEKIIQFYNYHWNMYVYYQHEEVYNRYVKTIFGEDAPSLSTLKNNVDMLFLNIHPIWEGNRPVPPGVVYMGGLHQKPEKELPADLKSYLDSSKNGVIYISFGSNIDPAQFPPFLIQSIINTVSQLPYDVLWKWNHDELPGKTENIKISKWLPQSDLLRHPNVKLFITQGGLQSTDEAITAGVPLVGIPVFGDQWYNVEKYVHHGIGTQVNLEDLANEDVLNNAITTVIGKESYRENIVRLRTLMHDQPMSSLERAVWWTEHVLRHGGARHLRAPAANMSFAEYYELQLVVIVFSLFAVVGALVIAGIYTLVKYVLRKFSSADKVKSKEL